MCSNWTRETPLGKQFLFVRFVDNRQRERERKTRKERRTPIHSSRPILSRRVARKVRERVTFWKSFSGFNFVSVLLLKKGVYEYAIWARKRVAGKTATVRGGNVHLFRYAALSKQPLTN